MARAKKYADKAEAEQEAVTISREWAPVKVVAIEIREMVRNCQNCKYFLHIKDFILGIRENRDVKSTLVNLNTICEHWEGRKQG